MIGAASINKKHTFPKAALAEPFLTKNILTQTETAPAESGVGIVSDPSTACLLKIGGVSGGGWFVPFANDFMAKGHMDGYAIAPPTTFPEFMIGADGGNYLNAISPALINAVTAQSKWRLTTGGLPMPIVEYQYIRDGAGIHFEAVAFSKDGIIYLPCSAMGLGQIRMSIKHSAADQSAVHFSSGCIHTVVISKVGWAYKIVFGCSQASHWYLGDAYRDPAGGAVFDDTSSPAGPAVDIGAGFEWSSAAVTNLQTCFALSLQPATLTDEQASNAMIAGLGAWETKYEEAITYWEGFWGSYNKRWDGLDPEIRAKGLIATQQLAAISYNGAIPAGPPTWVNPGVWVRDACWPLRTIVKVAPEFAKDCLEWFVGKTSLLEINSYTLDGVGTNVGGIPIYNTDNGAVFLLAAGAIWAQTSDVALFESLLPQMQAALTYAKTNYVPGDQHITALHPHDYWDEYVSYGGEMDTSLVKYESVIDVIWAAALRDIAPCLSALGESVDAAWCAATSTALIAGLEDYRDADLGGGLHYAIKTDDTLYDTVIALPGNIYAAHFLNDSGAKDFLVDRNNATLLGMKNFWPNYCVAFSNYLDMGHTKKDRTWGPHIPLVAGELAKMGNYDLVSIVADSMPFGSWGEGVCATTPPTRGRVKYIELAQTFSWSWGEIVQLCETLMGLNK